MDFVLKYLLNGLKLLLEYVITLFQLFIGYVSFYIPFNELEIVCLCLIFNILILLLILLFIIDNIR